MKSEKLKLQITADIKKEGPIYDLPILIAILKSTGQLSCDTDSSAFLGELSLNGEVRRINGVLPMALLAAQRGARELYVPAANAAEAAAAGIPVYGVQNVAQLLAHLQGTRQIPCQRAVAVTSHGRRKNNTRFRIRFQILQPTR